MDTRTGELYKFKNEEELKKKIIEFRGDLVEIKESEMTEKQKKNMRVSLYDNRSILGKRRIRSRRERNRLKRKLTKQKEE